MSSMNRRGWVFDFVGFVFVLCSSRVFRRAMLRRAIGLFGSALTTSA